MVSQLNSSLHFSQRVDVGCTCINVASKGVVRINDVTQGDAGGEVGGLASGANF